MERVTISMIQHSSICNKDPIDIVLEDIFKYISVHINFQRELIDNVSTKSTSEINVVYENALIKVKIKNY